MSSSNDVPMQPASLDIWDKKYRLKAKDGTIVDATIDDTYKRVATALAGTEATPELREHWGGRFLWAMRNGAIPAGRITSNAGAQEHKPATSTINCLGGATRVLTDRGLLPICDLVGRKTLVVNGNGDWSEVEFRSHGVQTTYPVSFRYSSNRECRDTIVRATAQHRWRLVNGDVVTTECWMRGVASTRHTHLPNVLPVKPPRDNGEHRAGVSHGLVYGDGHQVPEYWEMTGTRTDEATDEEVFCCEEPITHSFVIEGGLLTGNCTVSGTIPDSMDGILQRVHEAGLTLKAGCGIGYCFSTLRPHGAFVAGAGAFTSGPLSFMDIYDKTCFTVASAGGRRGAQMGTFDVSHPDVKDFVRAKREAGRLRQFNLSLLITDDFMRAVESDDEWPLVFPIHKKEKGEVDLEDVNQVVWREWETHDSYIVREDGLVACKVYDKVKARRLWDMIMSSTYDYAEPGFILIDKGNEMNNNWWCENIRATNPCVTADTRLGTQYGQVQAGVLCASSLPIEASVDRRSLGHADRGVVTRSAKPVFMTDPAAKVFRLVTEDGYSAKVTEWHDFYTERGKIKLRDMQIGDRVLVQSGKGQFGNQGTADLGVLLGLIAGDGHFTHDAAGRPVAAVTMWGKDRALADRVACYVNVLIANFSNPMNGRVCRVAPVAVASRQQMTVRSALLARALAHYGFNAETKLRVPEVVWRGSEECVKGYISALFQCDGTVNASEKKQSCSVRLASSTPSLLHDVQILLANFGVFCSVRKRREAQRKNMPNGHGGQSEYQCAEQYELIIDGESRSTFMREIGFLLPEKNKKYEQWADGKVLRKKQRFSSKVKSIEYIGTEPVFDTTQPDHNAVIFNGLVTGQCGEQLLPAFGSCLLGSVNLSKFVANPFKNNASFEWSKYNEVVSVFTRMLDNVVEINGLPLPQQREEITRKRRHGMGFLGLGSTLAMLGLRYGSKEAQAFTSRVAMEMAKTGWQAALDLAVEKGPAPLLAEDFEVTGAMLRKRPEMVRDGYKVGDKVPGRILHARYSRYMQHLATVAPELVKSLEETGARFTHHTSVAPTGTISLSLANNASNGIEPSFAHTYSRNVIREGRKTKEKVDVCSFELLAYRTLVDPDASPNAEDKHHRLPPAFVTADDISPIEHVRMQAAAQEWVDSSISKTANVPTDYPYEKFKDIYLEAYRAGLKGCTTFRFNPSAFQGVLVREEDLANTVYSFTLEDGTVIEARGNEEIEYDGETHTAANLHDAIKEGYYGRY